MHIDPDRDALAASKSKQQHVVSLGSNKVTDANGPIRTQGPKLKGQLDMHYKYPTVHIVVNKKQLEFEGYTCIFLRRLLTLIVLQHEGGTADGTTRV